MTKYFLRESIDLKLVFRWISPINLGSISILLIARLKPCIDKQVGSSPLFGIDI